MYFITSLHFFRSKYMQMVKLSSNMMNVQYCTKFGIHGTSQKYDVTSLKYDVTSLKYVYYFIHNVEVGSGAHSNNKLHFMYKLCYFFIKNTEICIFIFFCFKSDIWSIIKGKLCCSSDKGFCMVYLGLPTPLLVHD